MEQYNQKLVSEVKRLVQQAQIPAEQIGVSSDKLMEYNYKKL